MCNHGDLTADLGLELTLPITHLEYEAMSSMGNPLLGRNVITRAVPTLVNITQCKKTHPIPKLLPKVLINVGIGDLNRVIVILI